ncbi:GH92 family glycosyl hydrolase [Granulicella arctica]|uniref:GH92 family glycosyl hydrolase n=1 Tax=Granulicella arctica TaxID=940613 RepID=UPI0021DF72AF|nr:GH92 family glycosyl hydrolase [Granulicella arctica]
MSLKLRAGRLSALVCCTLFAASGLMAQVEPIAAVDPMIGTSNGGNTYPGATVPFGMIQWSPDTSQNFYTYEDKSIRGFSVTHLSGVGCPVFGDMPMLPMSVRPGAQRDLKHPETVPLDHTHETAQPGYYAITLTDGTRVELTTSDRSGMARLTFPKGQHAGVLINGAGSASTDVHMAFLPPVGREHDGESLSFGEDGTLTGTGTAGGFCGSPTKYTLHVAFAFQKTPVVHALWRDGALQDAAGTVSGKQAAAWVDLGNEQTQVIKVGLSYVSEEKARANLQAELPGWDFDKTRQQAQARWVKALATIQIDGANATDRRIFYTGLYHELIGQTLFSDVDGEYMGFDEKVHHLHAGQKGQYTNISDWDIYRNTVQMQALLFPQEASDLAQSLTNDAEQLGSYPRWATANDGSYVMGGDSPPIILASVYAFGAKNFDAKTALSYAVKAATAPGLGQHGKTERDNLADYLRFGYIPASNLISVSETLELTNADFATAQLAKALGDKPSEKLLLKHAENWRNLLDPSTRWMRPRLADGSWLPGFDAEKSLPHRPDASVSTDQLGFEEGNTYQYTFMLPFDYAGLFTAIGDKAVVEKRLDRFFEKLVCWGEPCFNMANEPDFVTPYVYTFLGKPWKTAEVITRIENETFNTTPGGIPGNDDLGATSGVYLWNTLGMYPAIPGLGGVVLGTPRFISAMVHTGAGGTLTITRHGDGKYVQSVMLNGVNHPGSWVPVEDLLHHEAHLDFQMGETPGSPWATGVSDLPPSQSTAK